MYKVRLDGEYIYHPWSENLSITSGRLTQELNKNGSFDFSITPDNPRFQDIKRRKSIVEVIRFAPGAGEEVIYRGCCLNDTDTMDWKREIQTDGDLMFLSDSVIRPYEMTGTPSERLNYLIGQHNSQVDDFKKFQMVTVSAVSDMKQRKQTEYCDTRTELDKLIEDFGGRIQTRVAEDGTICIDYLFDQDEHEQALRIGENIIDITRHVKSEEIVTRVIPLGTSYDGVPTTIASVNNGLDYIQDDEAINEFGIITKAVEFPDIDVPSQLLQAGKDYLASRAAASITIELTAVDLADMGADIEAINVGDWVPCVAEAFGIKMTMQASKKVTDLLKPNNSKITLGSVLSTYTRTQLGINSVTNMKFKNPSEIKAITTEEIDNICK